MRVIGLRQASTEQVLESLKDAVEYVREKGARGVAVVVHDGEDDVHCFYVGAGLEVLGSVAVLRDVLSDQLRGVD